MKILSTKVLTESQRNILKDFEIKEVPMIDISFGEDFVIDEKIENAIFTSANSVKSVFKIHKNKTSLFEKVYCVGNKTQYLLEKQGLKVEVVASNGLELAETLVKLIADSKNNIQEVNWFCGNIRNNDLPTIMAENGILVTEYIVYKTVLIPQKIEEDFDVILFFSPSGIKSFLEKNSITQKPVVCIGSTSATEAVQYFENVYIADEQTVEAVLLKAKEISNH